MFRYKESDFRINPFFLLNNEFFLIILFLQLTVCKEMTDGEVGWGSAERKNFYNECPRYDTKQSCK